MLTVVLALALLLSPESNMHGFVNDERVDRGKARLEVTDFLRTYAEGQATRMANQSRIFHDPCGGCGEVVGVRPENDTALDMFNAWMGSDDHRRILMDPDANRLGCGKVTSGGWDWWVCEVRYET